MRNLVLEVVVVLGEVGDDTESIRTTDHIFRLQQSRNSQGGLRHGKCHPIVLQHAFRVKGVKVAEMLCVKRQTLKLLNFPLKTHMSSGWYRCMMAQNAKPFLKLLEKSVIATLG